MSSEAKGHGPASSTPQYWRSLEEKERPESVSEAAAASDVTKGTIDTADLLRMQRRKFLSLTGAIAAAAGLEGCIRRPEEKILPYTEAPEYAVPGVPLHFATVEQQRGDAIGLLVESHENRPTKIEGNPVHPASLGAASLWSQASIWDLYDPDRSKWPTRRTEGGTHRDTQVAKVDAMLDQKLAELEGEGGRGLRLLVQPSSSPTFLRLRDAVMRRFPQARFHTYSPVNDTAALEGTRLAFDQALTPLYAFERAQVILSLDSDFLMTESGMVRAARAFADGRRLRSPRDEMSRLYMVEPSHSVTGSNADHRLPLAAQDIEGYLQALAKELVDTHGVPLDAMVAGALNAKAPTGVPKKWIKEVARELAKARGKAIVTAGSRQPARVHALAHALNHALGSVNATVKYVPAVDPAEPDQFQDIRKLANDMEAGEVDTLLVIGGNPAYDAPADIGFADKLSKVDTSLHLSLAHDETSEESDWHLPRAHTLECWGDMRAMDGTLSVQQPLIRPLWDGRSDIELLARVAGEASTQGHALVRTTMRGHGLTDETRWEWAVQAGMLPGTTFRPVGGLTLQGQRVAESLSKTAAGDKLGKGNFEAVFLADNKMLDGRYANNTWLLELPDPMTRIVWDNAVYLAPATAAELGVRNGDMVQLSDGTRSVDIVAWLLPGQAENSLGLPLGWGRRRAGRHGSGRGFDVYPLRTADSPHFTNGVSLKKLGDSYFISQTQTHDTMEGRPVAVETTLDEYKSTPNFAEYASPTPSTGPLWKTVDYSEGYKWGMNIDLGACIGCNACVIACQSENNVPVVGKDEVAKGREMAWLRIDRYFAGEADNPEVAFQPVACQHCEEAPCENVCPVNATAHSPEGLNDIAYNRCIGTRYCMNNCPYKVRRFNFLNFNEDIPEPMEMQKNPDVTVRFRGVIEKCSYCVQRIQQQKIIAKREDRRVRDGEVVTACQQTCPTDAIVFGDLNNPDAKAAKLGNLDRRYKLLGDVGTRPRTTYLGKVRNPNPEMQA